MAEKTIVPVMPLIGVTVMVAGGIMPPAATLMVLFAPLGPLMEKPGHVEPIVTVTTRGVLKIAPLELIDVPPVVSAGPIDPW